MNPTDPSAFAALFEQLLEGSIDDVSRARLIAMMEADPELRSEVARQLVRLPAGRYALQFETGAIPAAVTDRPLVSLSCAGASAPFFSVRPERAGEPAQRVRAAVTVPGDCRWQVFSIAIGSGETPAAFPWIANIALRPLG